MEGPPLHRTSSMRPHVAIAVLGLLALAAGGCGDSEGAGTTNPAQTVPSTSARHAAPAPEALLPNEIDGVRLTKASATGANVFGGDAFSRAMTTFLTGAGKRPSDLTFANARDASGALEVELGVFRVPGVGAGELRRAIVDSSRPGAPGSTTSRATIAGKPVTLFRYATGSTLYLYEQGDRVFYVGTLRPALAAKALAALP